MGRYRSKGMAELGRRTFLAASGLLLGCARSTETSAPHASSSPAAADHHAPELQERPRCQAGNRAAKGAQAPIDGQEVLARMVGREGAQAKLLGQRQHAVLARPDPLAAQVDGLVRAACKQARR